jgi:hypothetical protein
MPYAIGVGLAVATGLLGAVVGLDRDRAFYATVAIVVASYYALFAAMGGTLPVLAAESAVIVGFLVLAIAGFRGDARLIVVALAGHGLLDSVHGRLIANAGVPAWWPPFCLAYDVTAAIWLALLLRARARIPAQPAGSAPAAK